MQLKLINVRLSFPDLFKPKAVQPGSEPKYGASFLLYKERDAAQIDAVRKAMFDVATEKWGTKIPTSLKKCLHEGTEKSYDGYDASNMFLSASATVKPSCVDRDRSPLNGETGKPYAGCQVNAVVRLWAQDNQFGKRINAQLQGVQFVADGEAFGQAPFDPNQHFTAEGGSDNDGFDDVSGGSTAAADGIDPNTGFPVGF